MPIRKMQDYIINIKKEFVLRKRKVYFLSREKREEIYKFTYKQLKKGYIRPLKLSQTTSVFFVGKKDSKKYIVYNYRYLNE